MVQNDGREVKICTDNCGEDTMIDNRACKQFWNSEITGFPCNSSKIMVGKWGFVNLWQRYNDSYHILEIVAIFETIKSHIVVLF